jgi:4-hydroxyphenylpyruvate dioxygenase
VHFWVGNAKQAASHYVSRFGFEPVAFRGLETGSRDITTQVVKQGRIVFAFSSALQPNNSAFGQHLALHGDGVKDVALEVSDCQSVYEKAVGAGAHSVSPPTETSDEHGSVVMATVEPYQDTWHTFVERTGYRGAFLPGFMASPPDPISQLRPAVGLDIIDHVVSNQADLQMEPVVQWYAEKLGFHRFWSVDDKTIHTEYSSLRSVVVSDPAEVVKMPINEPANGKRKSQIQEFVDFYGGPGIQHIALNTSDILTAIPNLKACGVSFIQIPPSYYADLRKRLGEISLELEEDLDTIERLQILVDFDHEGYLLQTFTRPQQDRPTLFIEIIQRHGFGGFGAGNFKALFEAIERDQAARGNL